MPVRSATAQQALDALAARLREIRKDAELTARQVALAAGWHESKCSRIEHARTMPSPEDIRTWCSICGVPDQAADLTAALRSIDSMYVEWRRMVRSGMRQLQEAPLPLYERTRQFRIYEPGVIPGLFQTADYARARMGRIVEFNGIPDDLDTAVAARLERQRVLRRGDHRFAVVLEEWALRSRIGSYRDDGRPAHAPGAGVGTAIGDARDHPGQRGTHHVVKPRLLDLRRITSADRDTRRRAGDHPAQRDRRLPAYLR